jgi:hypothetical protein
MAIMPTRSFPPGAISDAGAVWLNATADKPASNAIDRRIRIMCPRLKGLFLHRNPISSRSKANSQYYMPVTPTAPSSLLFIDRPSNIDRGVSGTMLARADEVIE